MKTLISVAVVAVALAVGAAQSPRSPIASSKMFAALDVQRGQTVAEIGAGNGDLTLEVAHLVGPAGHVLTSELGSSRLDRLRRAVERSGLTHISVVEGDASATNFPDACCDAVFMRNVYHHFADPAAMNASIVRALKPGGRIAVIDFEPSRGRREAARPDDRADDDSHGTTAATVARELEAAGLHIVQTGSGDDRWFMVVARKPQEGKE